MGVDVLSAFVEQVPPEASLELSAVGGLPSLRLNLYACTEDEECRPPQARVTTRAGRS
jgi:hypothetical protein